MKLAAIVASLFVTAFPAFIPVFAASTSASMKEADALQAREGQEAGRPAYSSGHGVMFKPSDHVYIKNALAVDFTYRKASVTLPLYCGLSPDGKDVFYIITEAAAPGLPEIKRPSARGMIVTDRLRTLKSASAGFGRTRFPFFPSFLRTGSHTSKTSAYRCFLSRYAL
jgi:hypothetical protein